MRLLVHLHLPAIRAFMHGHATPSYLALLQVTAGALPRFPVFTRLSLTCHALEDTNPALCAHSTRSCSPTYSPTRAAGRKPTSAGRGACARAGGVGGDVLAARSAAGIRLRMRNGSGDRSGGMGEGIKKFEFLHHLHSELWVMSSVPCNQSFAFLVHPRTSAYVTSPIETSSICAWLGNAH